MIASDDIKEALASIGFEAEDISPEDDPAYTLFKNKDGYFFDVCLCKEVQSFSLGEVLEQIMASDNTAEE